MILDLNWCTLPETNIFFPENWWLGDYLLSLWVSAYIQGAFAVSFKESIKQEKPTSLTTNSKIQLTSLQTKQSNNRYRQRQTNF